MSWIKLKIRAGDPRIAIMAELTGASAERVFYAVVGRWFWWIDDHAEDENIRITYRTFRDEMHWPNDKLAKAMQDKRVDWLLEEDGLLGPTRWQSNMSKGAKVRAETAKRVSKLRGSGEACNATDVTKSVPRPEPDQTRPRLVGQIQNQNPETLVLRAADSVGRLVGPGDPEVGKMIRALGLNPTTERKLLSLPDLTGKEINEVYASVRSTPNIESVAAVVASELLGRRGIKIGRKGGPMASALSGVIGGALGNIEQIRRNRGVAS